MTLADIAGYQAKQREPVCFDYRERKICGMGPPSSGGITIAQTLKILEGYDLSDKGHGVDEPMVAAPYRGSRKARLRGPGPVSGRRRFRRAAGRDVGAGVYRDAAQTHFGLGDGAAEPGEPQAFARARFGVDATVERSGTSHLSIVDAAGNAVSMTTTIEGGFGSGIWAAGFLLNNELTDFSFRPADRDGRRSPTGSRAASGRAVRCRRRWCSMPQGKLQSVLGSVGGSRIITYVAKSLIALIDWGMSAQETADLVNFGSRGRDFELEIGPHAIWQGLKVKPFGHRIVPDLMTSGTHIIVVRPDGKLEGAADPRREGVARGG